MIALRYFNPIGAYALAEIGELPLGIPQNLVPFLSPNRQQEFEAQLQFLGTTTPPKTAPAFVMIHVVDLGDAHVVALKHLNTIFDPRFFDVLNVGTGKGTSVLEIVQAFERVTNVSLRYTIGERREGDVVETYADTTKINRTLGWQAFKNSR